MRTRLIALLFLLAVVSGTVGAAEGNATPVDVGDAFITGLNEGDLSAVSMLLADDFVAITPACVAAFGESGCTTSAQLEPILQATLLLQPQLTAGEPLETGSDVSYEVQWRDLFSAQLGLERALLTIDLTVEADHITRLVLELDLSDQETAAYAAALAQMQAPSMTPPSTGDAGLKA
jgi:hypothetical protein